MDIDYSHRFWHVPPPMVNEGPRGMAGICVLGDQGVANPGEGQEGRGWGAVKLPR